MLRGRPSANQTKNLSRQRPQQFLQTPPATTHPRFDRALRALQYLGYFTIRQFVEIAQQQYLRNFSGKAPIALTTSRCTRQVSVN